MNWIAIALALLALSLASLAILSALTLKTFRPHRRDFPTALNEPTLGTSNSERVTVIKVSNNVFLIAYQDGVSTKVKTFSMSEDSKLSVVIDTLDLPKEALQ